MIDIKALTPKQLGCGLMRGNRSELKQGYSAIAALGAVERMHQMTEADKVHLFSYLQGFSQGLNRIERKCDESLFDKDHEAGYKAGIKEDSFRIQPAPLEGEPTTEGIEA